MSYKFFLLINPKDDKIIYQSTNPFFEEKEIILTYENVRTFFDSYLSDAELERLKTIKRKISEFRKDEHYTSDYVFSYNLVFNIKKMKEINVHIENYFLSSSAGAKDIVFLLFSIARYNSPKELIAYDNQQDFFFNNNDNHWEKCNKIKLKKNETLVIRLGIQGYNLNQIAEKINKSVATVKKIRNSINEKLETTTIQMAYAHYINYHNLYRK